MTHVDSDLTAAQFADAALTSDDVDTVAHRFVQARETLDAWRSAVADIEAHLHAVMEAHGVKRLEVPGAGVLEASRKVKRTAWRWDDLLGDIARAAAVNRRLTADGELEPVEWVAVRLVQECVGFSSGKVTGIRRHLPHDVDEYATVGESEPVIKFARFDR